LEVAARLIVKNSSFHVLSGIGPGIDFKLARSDTKLSNEEKRALTLKIYNRYQDKNIENLKKAQDEIL